MADNSLLSVKRCLIIFAVLSAIMLGYAFFGAFFGAILLFYALAQVPLTPVPIVLSTVLFFPAIAIALLCLGLSPRVNGWRLWLIGISANLISLPPWVVFYGHNTVSKDSASSWFALFLMFLYAATWWWIVSGKLFVHPALDKAEYTDKRDLT
jgi:hypothetical protein